MPGAGGSKVGLVSSLTARVGRLDRDLMVVTIAVLGPWTRRMRPTAR